jgi:hypothetical protein
MVGRRTLPPGTCVVRSGGSGGEHGLHSEANMNIWASIHSDSLHADFLEIPHPCGRDLNSTAHVALG